MQVNPLAPKKKREAREFGVQYRNVRCNKGTLLPSGVCVVFEFLGCVMVQRLL